MNLKELPGGVPMGYVHIPAKSCFFLQPVVYNDNLPPRLVSAPHLRLALLLWITCLVASPDRVRPWGLGRLACGSRTSLATLE